MGVIEIEVKAFFGCNALSVMWNLISWKLLENVCILAGADLSCLLVCHPSEGSEKTHSKIVID